LVEARPTRASLEPGEAASIRVVVSRPVARSSEAVPDQALLRVTGDDGALVYAGGVALEGAPELPAGLAPIHPAAPLGPGLYHAEVTLPDAPFQPHAAQTGFWVRDARLLAEGPRLSASRDWIRQDGHVLPVIGTTYMASDVHRKFLFEPNPHLWDR